MPQRWSVVGAVGAGKSSLAQALAQALQLPLVELDAWHYGPAWQAVPEAEFSHRVAQQAGAPGWVIDGNYESVRDLVWLRADVLVWLDYPLPTALWRLLTRTLRRLLSGERFAGGNREQWRRVFGRQSILAWALRSHRPRRRHYEALLAEPRYRHLRVLRLRRPADARRLLADIGRPAP